MRDHPLAQKLKRLVFEDLRDAPEIVTVGEREIRDADLKAGKVLDFVQELLEVGTPVPIVLWLIREIRRERSAASLHWFPDS